MNFKKIIKYLPLFFTLLFAPATVRLAAVEIPESVALYWTGVPVDYDIFSFTKSTILIVAAIIIFVIMFFTFDFKKLKSMKKYFIPVAIMFVFALISTFTGGNSDIALSGAPTRYEGLYTYISYFLIYIYCLQLDTDNSLSKAVITLLGIFTFLTFLVGASQYFNKDFFLTDFAKKIYIPSEYAQFRETTKRVEYNFRNIYAFTSHYNYMAMLTSMLSLFWLTNFSLEKEKKYKALSLICSAMSLFLLFGSNARSGIVAFAGGLVLVFFTFIKKLYKNKFTFIFIALLAAGGAYVYSNTNMMARLGSLINDIKGLSSISTVELHDVIPLKEIAVGDDFYLINFDNVQIKYDKTKDEFFDANNNIIEINPIQNDNITFKDPKYSNFNITLIKQSNKDTDETKLYHNVNLPIGTFSFEIGEKVVFVNHLGIPRDLSMLDTKEAYNYDLLGSGRGYITRKCIPLLKSSLLKGYGPDSFIKIFNQDDIYTKTYVYNDPNQIVDKPHNLYILTAVNFGVPALIAFLSITVMLAFDYAKYYSKNKIASEDIIGIAALCGVLAYMMSGFFNDSVNAIAPIYWTLLGISANSIIHLKSESKKEIKHKS